MIKPNLPVKDKLMWHVVIHIGQDGPDGQKTNQSVGVEMTTNPYEHVHKAAIIMHKSSSRQVAAQIARFVRRTIDVDKASINKSSRPREAMLGYAVTTTTQFKPDHRTPHFELVKRIAATPISTLMESVSGGHNAARTRYTVCEVRTQLGVPLGLFVSNKMHAVDRMWLDSPPDKVPGATLHVMGRHETRELADVQVGGLKIINRSLWTRKPDIEWIRKHVSITGKDLVFTNTGNTAIREYSSGRRVIIGPHVYTVNQILRALREGYWYDGRESKTDELWM